MNLIETYNGSGFYAQYATSADNALYDENGTPLTSYQPVSSMTAYQEAGDYYSASNQSGFITGVPAGTMNESAFEYNGSNKISAYNGSAFAGGGGTDLDFGYDESGAISSINTSALSDVGLQTFVNNNSAMWGGSALPISAGPGIEFNYINGVLVISTASV